MLKKSILKYSMAAAEATIEGADALDHRRVTRALAPALEPGAARHRWRQLICRCSRAGAANDRAVGTDAHSNTRYVLEAAIPTAPPVQMPASPSRPRRHP
jgi:hypothetical protein